MEKVMGGYAVAGQFQQRPVPRGGGLFKSDWVQYWDTLPERFDASVISWDMTFKDSKASDFVVGQVWGRKATLSISSTNSAVSGTSLRRSSSSSRRQTSTRA